METIQQFRQPMVTATGIFLGFMLEYTISWMPDAFSTYLFRDIIAGTCITISIASLLTVLFRILRMNYPTELAAKYYRKTLMLFLIGVSVPFFGFLINLIVKIVTNVN